MRNNGHPAIGRWHIDWDANELVDGAESVRLPPKSMAVLNHLFEHEGRTVSRDELMTRAALSDEGLSRVVAELRKVLGDDARSPRFIKTIPRVGYRLVAPSTAGPSPALRRAGWVAMVAVLGGSIGWWALRSAPVDSNRTVQERTLSGFPEDAVNPSLRDPWVYFRRMTSPPAIWRLHRETLQTEPVSEDSEIGFHLPPGGSRPGLQVRRTPATCTVEGIDPPYPVIARCRPGSGPGPVGRSLDGRLVIEREPGPGERHGLEVLNPATGERFRLTEAPVGLWDAGPRVSPDGQWVAFSRGDETIRELYLIELRPERTARALSSDRQKIFGLDWTSSECLVVASDRTGRRQLWEWRREGSALHILGGADAFGVIAVPGGVIYEHPIFRADIFRLGDDGPVTLVRSDRYDNHPRFSPSGRQLAFISNRDGYAGLWVADADGSNQRRLYQPDRARVTRPYWIDDDRLMAVVFREQASEVVAIELTTGKPHRLIGPDFAPRQAVALADGSVVFVSDRGVDRWHRGEVASISAETVEQIEVSSGDLVARIAGEAPLYVVDTDGRRHPLNLPYDGPVSAFSAAGQWLAWSDKGGTHVSDRSASTVVSRHDQVPSAIGLTLDIDPRDGSVVMSTTVDRRIDLIELRTALACR